MGSPLAVARLRRTLAILLIVAAAVTGAVGALALVQGERRLSVGTIAIGISPFHRGSLDLYVPLVDWGARFDGVRLPARLNIEVRAVDRDVVQRVARGRDVDVQAVRAEARDAIASYLRVLLAVALTSGIVLGGLVAAALRGHWGPRVRVGMAIAVGTSLVSVGLVALLLPPRGRIAEPTYYAHGPDLPRALDALQSLRRSGRALDQELNGQLVGLARLVVSPGEQAPLAGRPRLVLASDLHNNVLALPTLQRAAAGLPLIFAGDLTDKGTPLETTLVQRIARMGRPTVVVGGNHDSDTLLKELAADGAIVLTQFGRLRADGSHGPKVLKVGGLRMAGYTDPFLRRAGQAYEDRFRVGLTNAAAEDFRRWFDGIENQVDVIVVHEPEVAISVLAELRRQPPDHPIMILDAHTHRLFLQADPNLLEVNGGSIGAGGTGNLADERSNLSLAIVTYRLKPTALPLAVDQVTIDPGSGGASARRVRVDREVRARVAAPAP
ncbi:MAG TPA: metallophosphoesterase family protein [Baekduia sp.]|nr:metallophosphoesterase family protein [Baekduia sp.]